MSKPTWTAFAAGTYTYEDFNTLFEPLFGMFDPTYSGTHQGIADENIKADSLTNRVLQSSAVCGSAGSQDNVVEAKSIGAADIEDNTLTNGDKFQSGADLSAKSVVTYRSKWLGDDDTNKWQATGVNGLIVGTCSRTVTFGIDAAEANHEETFAPGDFAGLDGSPLGSFPMSGATPKFIPLVLYTSGGVSTQPIITTRSGTELKLEWVIGAFKPPDGYDDDKAYWEDIAVSVTVVLLRC